MRIDVTTSGDFKQTISWLNKSKDRLPTKAMHAMGKEGVSALRSSTPKGDTGQTASGWSYTVENNKNGAMLAFVNNAHPHTRVNVARLIQFGHGTGTGGYVPPIDYINPALRSILSTMGDRIVKEVIE